jgi:hypothetical protein
MLIRWCEGGRGWGSAPPKPNRKPQTANRKPQTVQSAQLDRQTIKVPSVHIEGVDRVL